MRKSLLATLIATASVAGLAAAPMAHADDYYLKINGVSGDQSVGKVRDAIKLKSFDLSVENPTTMGSPTSGGTTDKPSFKALEIEKDVDATSPLLFQLLTTDKPIDGMELIAVKPGATGAPIYQRYFFTPAVVTDQQHSSRDGGIDETVSFAYGAMQMTYVKQLANGATQNVFAVWNATANINALALPGKPAPNPYLF